MLISHCIENPSGPGPGSMSISMHHPSRPHLTWLLYINLLSSNLATYTLNYHFIYDQVCALAQSFSLFRVNTTLNDPVMTGIISMPVQILMAWRIMVVTETRL
ncbi:hypothetical protein C8J56DRAFT_1050380 [Mycena floridula]|nr:hypothetical protein C8J56DRAFT_1050380 [Mycena floridula]